MNQLNQFYNNEGLREAVRTFMVECLADMAVEKTFDGDSVVGIKEARDLIDVMFNKLEEKYAKLEAPIIRNSK